MAIHCYDDRSGTLYGYLVDVHLPDSSVLVQKAEGIANEINALPKEEQRGLLERPQSMTQWDSDAIFEYIAYNTRGMFHKNRPKECMKYTWSEAWLLKPGQLEKGYELKEEDEDSLRRRFLVTLYDGCKHGKECLANLVEKSGLEVISDDMYKDINTFREDSENLLDDIALPFKAPCIVAGEKIAEHGYEYRAFGN